MKKVLGYIRCSTYEQEASGLGLESQIDKMKTYCSLYNLDLIHISQDAASGKNLRRPGLQDVLEKLEKKEAEGIIIAKLDRLTRSVKDMGILLETYFTNCNSLYVVLEQIDTSTATGRMMLNVLISVAQWERETISERTKDALTAKRKRGEKLGGSIPFGYDFDRGKLVKNRQEQKVIRRIKNLRCIGYSYQKISDRLNRDRISTKTGKSWNYKIVRKIFLRENNV